VPLASQFSPLLPAPESTDPLAWPGYSESLARAKARTGRQQGVCAGLASIRGWDCVLVAFDFSFFGGSMGAAEGEYLVSAVELARRRRLPFVSFVRSGGARMQEGIYSLVQMRRVAGALQDLAAAGCPHVSVAAHPTTGGVWASLAAAADFVVAEQGAEIGFAGSRTRPGQEDSAAFSAAQKWHDGFVDVLCAPCRTAQCVAEALSVLSAPVGDPGEPPALPRDLAPNRPQRGRAQVARARRRDRPRADAYVSDYFERWIELRGDRCGAVDPGLLAGFGLRSGRRLAFIAQLGMPTSAAGFRTASRLLRLANLLRTPVLTFVDCPGAANDASAELAGVGTAIAQLLADIASSKVPVRSVVVGEGGSGGALALAAEDSWMSADSYFSVTAPELAAAILKWPPERTGEVAELLRLAPEDLIDAGFARGMLPVTASA
jgi:acetyl-CoA carboxylase beta subunit